MPQRSNNDYEYAPWGPSDGICRCLPHEPDVDRLPKSIQRILRRGPELMKFYSVFNDSLDTNEHAYGHDVRLMRYLTVICPGLTKTELLTVFNEFANGLSQFSEYDVMAVGDWCGTAKEYVEKLVSESGYDPARCS